MLERRRQLGVQHASKRDETAPQIAMGGARIAISRSEQLARQHCPHVRAAGSLAGAKDGIANSTQFRESLE
jgi:hypothetical protein